MLPTHYAWINAIFSSEHSAPRQRNFHRFCLFFRTFGLGYSALTGARFHLVSSVGAGVTPLVKYPPTHLQTWDLQSSILQRIEADTSAASSSADCGCWDHSSWAVETTGNTVLERWLMMFRRHRKLWRLRGPRLMNVGCLLK